MGGEIRPEVRPSAPARSRGHFADKWQLDEMVVTIKGKKYWLWRAVDANGYVLEPCCKADETRQPLCA